MKDLFMNKKLRKIHFIGIGGISMSALAIYCIEKGVKVSGSDRVNNLQTKKLKKLGAKIFIGHKESNIFENCCEWEDWQCVNLKDAPDLVAYSCAIDKNNVELKFAKNLGIKIMKRSEFMSLILNNHTHKIAVSGSHGKTTSTSLIASVFINAKINPTVFVGGETLDFGNVKIGDDNFAIFEACEYNKNFLDFPVTTSVVLNIDNDHLDCYKNIQNEVEAFKEFVNKSNVSIICADDINAKKCINKNSITYGINSNANYTAKNLIKKEKGYSFSVFREKSKLGRINLSIEGKFNVYNALVAVVVSDLYKIPFKHVKSGIESFRGVERRNQFIGKFNETPVFCDYAHHPTEINAIINEYDKKGGKTAYVFQPHTYSRTKELKADFVKCFSSLQNLVIYKTYSAREKYNKQGSAKTLYNDLLEVNKLFDKNIYYVQNKNQIISTFNLLEKKVDRFLILGAGDLYDVIKKIIRK